jgi:uncharacterized protein HemX
MRNPLRRRSKTSDAHAAPEAPATKPAKAAAKPTTGQAAASADPQERIDGLRAWLAQVDRKLGVRSYAGGAAIVLALAAGIVGVVLALSAKDESATKDDLAKLRDQVAEVSQQASAAAEEQVGSLADRVQALEEQVSSLSGDQRTTERELQVAQDDIDDIRTQISSAIDNLGNSPNSPDSGR